ncbi:5107_t:CDS:2, partial [Cetraspora pellucida]
KGMIQGIKNAIDNWLYLNEKIYEQAIRQELEALCPDKIALFGSFWHAIFDHVFKKKVSPTVNSESSESNIISWKESNEVQWCFENLDSMIEKEDKTYLQMVAKKVFGRQPTKNQYAVTQAILHNLFNSEIVKIKFDKKDLT